MIKFSVNDSVLAVKHDVVEIASGAAQQNSNTMAIRRQRLSHVVGICLLLLIGSTSALTLGYFEADTFHSAAANAVSQILTQAGVDHDFVGKGHAENYEDLFKGEVDVVVDGWLPTGHAGYLADHTLGEDYVVAGPLYDEGIFYWIASPALVAAGLTSLDQLLNASAFPQLDRTIYGPTSDSGLGVLTLSIIDSLNAEPANAAVPFSYAGDFDGMKAKLAADATSPSEQFLCASWAPMFANAAYPSMTPLDSGAFSTQFGVNNYGVNIIRADALPSGSDPQMDAATLQLLSNIFIGTDNVNTMDANINLYGYTAAQAAAAWLATNYTQRWIPYWSGFPLSFSQTPAPAPSPTWNNDVIDPVVIGLSVAVAVLAIALIATVIAFIARSKATNKFASLDDKI